MLKSIFDIIQRCSFVRNLALILAALLLIAECSRMDDGMVRGRKSINDILDKAELLLDEDPVLTDSLIKVAVRFYSIGNNMEYRFLSNYYLGCVYLNLMQYSEAAAAYANAEQLLVYINNDYWKGLLYYRLGVIFSRECDYHRADEYFSKSVSCYERTDKEQHRLYAMLLLGQTRIDLQMYSDADSI